MTHNPTHPAGGAGVVKWKLVPTEPTPKMLEDAAFNLSDEFGAAFVKPLGEFAKAAYAELVAAAPTPVPEPTAADMRAFGASAVAAYKWPGDTPEHRAARAAYCEGAASVVPEPEAEGEAPAPALVSSDEHGWLVELRDQTPSWAVLFAGDYDDHWTPDSTKALRFARKADAEAFIAWHGWTEAFASEHSWSGSEGERGERFINEGVHLGLMPGDKRVFENRAGSVDEEAPHWHAGRWGDGSTPEGMLMIFCAAHEAAIAGPMPWPTAMAVVDAHNEALSALAPDPTAEGEAVVKLVDQIHALLSFTNPIPPIPRTARLLLKRAARALAHPPSSEAEGEAVAWRHDFPGGRSACELSFERLSDEDKARGWVETPLYTRPSSEAEIADLRAKLELMRQALEAVTDATSSYLPSDGISAHECINRVLAATDNPEINAVMIGERNGTP